MTYTHVLLAGSPVTMIRDAQPLQKGQLAPVTALALHAWKPNHRAEESARARDTPVV